MGEFRILERGCDPEPVLLVCDDERRRVGLYGRHPAGGVNKKRLGADKRVKLLRVLCPRQWPKS